MQELERTYLHCRIGMMRVSLMVGPNRTFLNRGKEDILI
jgi:hypothetical protein